MTMSKGNCNVARVHEYNHVCEEYTCVWSTMYIYTFYSECLSEQV